MKNKSKDNRNYTAEQRIITRNSELLSYTIIAITMSNEMTSLLKENINKRHKNNRLLEKYYFRFLENI